MALLHCTHEAHHKAVLVFSCQTDSGLLEGMPVISRCFIYNSKNYFFRKDSTHGNPPVWRLWVSRSLCLTHSGHVPPSAHMSPTCSCVAPRLPGSMPRLGPGGAGPGSWWSHLSVPGKHGASFRWQWCLMPGQVSHDKTVCVPAPCGSLSGMLCRVISENKIHILVALCCRKTKLCWIVSQKIMSGSASYIFCL